MRFRYSVITKLAKATACPNGVLGMSAAPVSIRWRLGRWLGITL